MSKRFAAVLFALLFASLAPPVARADDPPPVETSAPAAPVETPESTPASVFAWGVDNPDCHEWTNACQTCARDEKGVAQCSTVGIACVPGPMVCASKAK